MAIMEQSDEPLIQQGKLFLLEDWMFLLHFIKPCSFWGRGLGGPIEAILLSSTKTFG